MWFSVIFAHVMFSRTTLSAFPSTGNFFLQNFKTFILTLTSWRRFCSQLLKHLPQGVPTNCTEHIQLCGTRKCHFDIKNLPIARPPPLIPLSPTAEHKSQCLPDFSDKTPLQNNHALAHILAPTRNKRFTPVSLVTTKYFLFNHQHPSWINL